MLASENGNTKNELFIYAVLERGLGWGLLGPRHVSFLGWVIHEMTGMGIGQPELALDWMGSVLDSLAHLLGMT